MANDYTKNPLVLDTAGGGAEQTTRTFLVQSVEWKKPTTADHTAIVLDADGNTICNFTCVVGNQNMIKYFNPAEPFRGINVATLGSGVVYITRR